VPGIETGALDLYPGTLATRPQRWSKYNIILLVYKILNSFEITLEIMAVK
jgi:hypothetical protein